jgi:hypothetical protein
MVLLVNVAGMILAYGVIYPLFLPMTQGKIILIEAFMSAILVGTSVAWFRDSHMQFLLLGWYWGLRSSLWPRI